MDVLAVVVLAVILAVAVWFSPWTYQAAMERAEARDLAYFQAHPDCSWDAAHYHRERTRRLFLRP